MNILEELFTNVSEFRRYSPYTESNVSFQELNSSALSAKKQIVIILSKDVYDEIVNEEGEKKEALRSAMANLTLSKQMIFDVISRRKNDVDIYKSEQDIMRRSYTDNYYNAMDSLIQLLSESSSAVWGKTRYAKLIDSLQIKETSEFDSLYPIDLSYLFFFRIIPYQKEALETVLSSYFERVKDKPELKTMLLRCLAKQTVSIALRRMDILEFPSTIRSLFEDSKVMRYGTQEQNRILELSESLANEVRHTLSDIDLILSGSGDSIDTETSFNRPDDKIYLMA